MQKAMHFDMLNRIGVDYECDRQTKAIFSADKPISIKSNAY